MRQREDFPAEEAARQMASVAFARSGRSFHGDHDGQRHRERLARAGVLAACYSVRFWALPHKKALV